MDEIRLSPEAFLRRLRVSDAPELYAVIDANRDFLRPWMPWAHEEGLEQTVRFLAAAETQAAADDGFQAAIVDAAGAIAGTIGFHRVDWTHRATSIGYWLAERATGRGTMTAAVRALVELAFADWNLNRIEIRAAVANERSRRVAERLAFLQEGVLREVERHPDGFRDLVVYGLLRREWRAASQP